MHRKIQSGFSLVPALFLLVVLAALGIVAVRLAGVQHQTVQRQLCGVNAVFERGGARRIFG
jgi:Tfp pilus assembly protein PilX